MKFDFYIVILNVATIHIFFALKKKNIPTIKPTK